MTKRKPIKRKPAPKEDPLASARRQGQAQFDSIKEMVEALNAAHESEDVTSGAIDKAREAIQDDALSIQVRSGWYQPGASDEDRSPAEYEILLCTGGPACRIVGRLSEHGEPETAQMEVQDWFQPWTPIRPVAGMTGSKGSKRDPLRPTYDSEPVMLEYARCFWFGDGQ